MEIFGFAIMLLSIVIAWQTWRNGRWMREMLRTIHEQGEQRHREVVDLLVKMDERTAKISEQIEKIPEKTRQVIKS